MTTLAKDGSGTLIHLKSTGEGTLADPKIQEVKETSATAILAALTAMNGYVDGLEAALTTLTGHQDGVEGLIGTTNTTLTALAGYVDTLETLIAATNTALSTLGGYQDGVETLLGTTNTSLTTLAGHVDGLEALVTLLNGYIDGLEALTGAINETAPATDTASSAVNGRLQRIAQNITTLIGRLPAALGQATMANSLAVTVASNQSTLVVNPQALVVTGNAHTKNISLSSAVTLTAPGGANKLLIQATVQNVRYTLDSTTPTASTGFVLKAGNDPMIVDIGAGMTVKVIEETSGAQINYQWGS